MPKAQILQYQIERKLGSGGFGEVFLAFDTRLDRPVALKFLPVSGLSDDNAALLSEARAVSRLHHPNIMTVFAVEEHDGRLFLVLEYAPGSDLRSWLASGSHDLAARLDVAVQVLSGLTAAHTEGVLHGDIKPENVHVGDDGRVRLLDFGLARRMQPGTEARLSLVRGTTSYLSPEQIAGQPLDVRSDLFSFGVLLYELLSDRRPFEGDYEPALLYAISFSDPDDLRELGVPCSDRLWKLVSGCLAKSPAGRPASGVVLGTELERELAQVRKAALANPLSTGLSIRRKPEVPFLGRQSDWQKFSDRLEQAMEGRGFAMFFSGEAGIGKTRLLEEAMEEGRRRGLSVFNSACLPQGGGMLYHPFTSALKRNFQRLDARVLSGLCERAQEFGYDLSSRLPALRAFLQLEAGDTGLLNREQLWDAVLHLLSAMAKEHPLLFVVDDLHWADRATLDLLAYLARNVSDVPLLFLCGYRTGETASEAGPSAIEQVVRQLRLEQLAESVPLERLSREHTAELANHLLPSCRMDASVLSQVVENSAGNPLFLVELVSWMGRPDALRPTASPQDRGPHAIPSGIPERVRDVIGARLDLLGADDRELLAVASCETRDFGSDALAECASRPRLDVLQRLQELERTHRMIRHHGNRYEFDHPLIKQVLYESLLPELKQEYHRMLALRIMSKENAQGAARGIVHHLLAAGEDRRALPYLLSAGVDALELFAVHEALAHFTRAAMLEKEQPTLDAASRVTLLRGLGDACASSGDTARALECFRVLVALAIDSGDASLLSEARRKQAQQLAIRGELNEALQLAETALANARPDSPEEIALLNALAQIHTTRGEYEQAVGAATRARAAQEHAADRGDYAVTLNLLGSAYLHQGQSSMAAGSLQEAVDLQRALGDRKGLAQSLNALALALGYIGRFERALECHFESLSTKEQLGEARTIPGSLNGIGDIFRELGDLSKARDYHTRSLALAREHGNVGSECDNLRDLGADHLLQGEMEQGEVYLRSALSLAREKGYPWYETRALISLVPVAVKTDRPSEARAHADLAMTLARKLGTRELLAEALRVGAALDLSEGKTEIARDALLSASDIARQHEHGWTLLKLLGDIVRGIPATDPAVSGALHEARTLVNKLRAEFKNPELLLLFNSTDAVRALGP